MKKIFNLEKSSKFSLNVRKKILEMSFNAGSASAHIGGALSSSDIISVIFSEHMKYDKSQTKWEKRDRFILSKGHGAPALFQVLAHKGFFPEFPR